MTSTNTERTAVILFNLGGPDSLQAVQPFLFNLFNDEAIIRLKQPVRKLLARFISTRRAKKAQGIYEKIGGKSPLLENTKAQAEALETALKMHGDFKVFICMRYWHPFASEAAMQVQLYNPTRIIMLPLYPQFSTTTTASSFRAWNEAAMEVGLAVPTRAICCYPTETHFAASHINLIRASYWRAAEEKAPRILFSAHGLPEKIVKTGDPYVWQVSQTVQAVVNILSITGLDYSICYQSRVGPVKWVGPSAESELERAGREKKPVVLVPISFVSEHSETLVELDIDYDVLARSVGVPVYERVPALGIEPFFIESLVALCLSARSGNNIRSHTGARICPVECSGCPVEEAA